MGVAWGCSALTLRGCASFRYNSVTSSPEITRSTCVDLIIQVMKQHRRMFSMAFATLVYAAGCGGGGSQVASPGGASTQISSGPIVAIAQSSLTHPPVTNNSGAALLVGLAGSLFTSIA